MAAGEAVVNGWLSCSSTYVAEVLSHIGYDSVTVDLQHGMFGDGAAISLLHAIGSGPAIPMARPSALDGAQIGKLLDGGAYGIICPSIDSAEQAQALVSYCRYPPTGRRSFGPSRGLLYGGSDYVDCADTTILVWAMIESTAAVNRLDEILDVSGLDGVYVGPNDLALSLGGRPGDGRTASIVEELQAKVATTARSRGRLAGSFCTDGREACRLIELGYHLVTPGNDVALLRDGALRRIRESRGEVTGDTPLGAGR